MHYRLIGLLLVCLALPAAGQSQHPLVLISLDGFRWDYLDAIPTPNFDRLIQRGFRVRRVIPCFPSLTFPNHYALVTGQSPDKHGLMANHMYDEAGGKVYDKANQAAVSDGFWYQAPAIWEIARQHDLESASFFWVGSEMNHRSPTSFETFRFGVSFEDRLARLDQWLDTSRDPSPALMLMYYEHVDLAGHHHGPDSVELIQAVKQADWLIGQMMDVIKRRNPKAHLVVVSDHGMTSINRGTVQLEELHQASGDDFDKVLNNYSQVDIFLKNPTPQRIETVLANMPTYPFLNWYTRGNAPFPTHPNRSGHLIGVLEPGYEFIDMDPSEATYAGGHGYRTDYRDMHTFAVGFGPLLNSGIVFDEMKITEIFPMLLHLLDLPTDQVSQRLKVWQPALKPLPGGQEGTP